MGDTLKYPPPENTNGLPNNGAVRIGNSFILQPLNFTIQGRSVPKFLNPPIARFAGKIEASLRMPHSQSILKNHLLYSPIEKAGAR